MSDTATGSSAAPGSPTMAQTWALLAGRLAVVSFYMGLVVFYHYRYAIDSQAPPNLLPVAVAYGLSIIYTVTIKFVRSLATFVMVQSYVDLLLVAAMIFYTGGVQSPFSFLFLFVIIAVSILLKFRDVLFISTASAVVYTLLIAMEYYGKIDPFYPFLPVTSSANAGYYFVTGATNISAFYLVAFLSGYLSELLRESGRRLVQASEDFTALQAFHENVLKNMGSGMMAIDLSGKILSCNRAARKILSKEEKEIIRSDAAHTLGLPIFSSYIEALDSNTQKLRQFDWLYQSPNGVTTNLAMTVSEYLVSDKPKGVIAVFHDVTEIKSMERRVAHAERLATIGRMAAGMAHEIRNPLASLSGSIQILSADLEPLLGENDKKLVEITNREVKRLNRTITQFLDYASPSKTEPEKTNISEILKETLTLFRATPKLKSSVIIIEDIAPDLFAKVDPEQLRQVIWNLLSNSIEEMPEAGRLTVKAAILPGDKSPDDSSPDLANTDTLVFSVADTGKGIPPENHEKIFDPFFTTKIGGTGLGLATCYKIILSFGGELRVESAEGEGAKFIVRLPVSAI